MFLYSFWNDFDSGAPGCCQFALNHFWWCWVCLMARYSPAFLAPSINTAGPSPTLLAEVADLRPPHQTSCFYHASCASLTLVNIALYKNTDCISASSAVLQRTSLRFGRTDPYFEKCDADDHSIACFDCDSEAGVLGDQIDEG